MHSMRVAIFVDQVFWPDGHRLSTDESYALFYEQFVGQIEHIVFISRQAPTAGQGPLVLNSNKVSLLPFPFYESLFKLWKVKPSELKAFRQHVQAEAKSWDAVLINGPHPIGQWIARDLRKIGVPVIPVLRQNMSNIMASYPGIKGVFAQHVARLLELDFKRLARNQTTLTVGGEMTEVYRQVSDYVQPFMPSLVDKQRFEQLANTSAPGSTEPNRLISVGRLAPEKDHSTLLAALRLLKDKDINCHLDIVGDGPLDDAIRQQVDNDGLQQHVTLHGFDGRLSSGVERVSLGRSCYSCNGSGRYPTFPDA